MLCNSLIFSPLKQKTEQHKKHPYNCNLYRGKFGELQQIRQSFTCQLLVTSEIAIEAGNNFVKV